MPLRWISSDARMVELRGDLASPIDLGAAETFKSPVWDERYWFAPRCFEDCENRDSFGTPRSVERIDRATGGRLRLTKGIYGFHSMTLFDEDVYWGLYGHGIGGGVFRVAKTGGTEEAITFETGRYEDKIEDLITYPNGILVRGTSMLGWIPRNESPKVLLRQSVAAAVLDSGDYFVATEGEPGWDAKASGAIKRVTHDGIVTTLAQGAGRPLQVAGGGHDARRNRLLHAERGQPRVRGLEARWDSHRHRPGRPPHQLLRRIAPHLE